MCLKADTVLWWFRCIKKTDVKERDSRLEKGKSTRPLSGRLEPLDGFREGAMIQPLRKWLKNGIQISTEAPPNSSGGY